MPWTTADRGTESDDLPAVAGVGRTSEDGCSRPQLKPRNPIAAVSLTVPSDGARRVAGNSVRWVGSNLVPLVRINPKISVSVVFVAAMFMNIMDRKYT